MIQGSVYAGFFDGTSANRASYVVGTGFVGANPNYWCEVTGQLGYGRISGLNIPQRTFSLVYTGPTKTYKLQRSTGCSYIITCVSPTNDRCFSKIFLPATGSHDFFDNAVITSNISLPTTSSFRVTVTPERKDVLGNFVFRIF